VIPSPRFIILLLLLLPCLLGCGQADQGPVPIKPSPVPQTPPPEEVRAATPDGQESILLEELAGLARMGPRAPEDPQRETALWALARVAPGRPGLLAELREADMLYCCMPRKGENVSELAEVWPELITLLNSLLHSPDPGERRRTAGKLKEASGLPPALRPALVGCLKDSDLETRVHAALILVRMAPDTEHLAVVLVDAFQSGDYYLIMEAHPALRDLGPRAREAAEPLARMAGHEDLCVVREAVKALGCVDAPEIAILALLSVFVEPENDGDLPPWHFSLDRLMGFAAISLASYGDEFPGAVELFLKYLPCNQWVSYRRGHENTYIGGRDWAAEALGMLGPSAEPAIPALVTALSYGPGCAYDAGNALVRIGPPGIDALVGALDHPSKEIRETAGSHLSGLRLPSHEPAFRRALKDESIHVRAYACAALLRIDPDSQEFIAEALRLIEDEDLGDDREWLRGQLTAPE